MDWLGLGQMVGEMVGKIVGLLRLNRLALNRLGEGQPSRAIDRG
jgi:hypothetical protein